MRLHIRSHLQLVDASSSTTVGAPSLPVAVVPSSLPPARSPRARRALVALRRVRLLPGPVHLRHRWEVTGGDDAHQLAFGCTVCGRVRRSTGRTTSSPLAPESELRRMR